MAFNQILYSMGEYEKIFDSISSDQKIEFLRKALTRSEALQDQLVAYFAAPTKRRKIKSGSFAERVQSYSKAFQKLLESIDLEDLDYSQWRTPRDTYMEYWEIEMELAKEEIQEVFNRTRKECEKQILAGDLQAFFTTFTGALDGCNKVTFRDPNETLADPEETLFALFGELTAEIEVYLSAVVLSSSKVVESVTSVVQWFLEQNQGNSSAVYHDRLCSKLALTHGESLGELRFLFSGPKGVEQNFPRTYLTVLRNLDRSAWIKESEKFAVADHQIAKELLEYQSEQKNDSFYRNARVLFPIHPRELVDFLAKLIEPGKDHALAIQIWEYKVLHQNLLNDYEILAGLFENVSQKEVFLTKLKDSYHDEFYVDVLAHEKLFERILELARERLVYLPKLEFMLNHILEVYPRDCLKIALRRTENEMKNSKLNRHTYSRIASLLRLVGTHKELKPEVQLFARNLMVIHSRRSALRAELVTVGLI